MIGNIYESDLHDIINVQDIRKHREDSMNGRLHCFKDCNWIRGPKNDLPQGSEIHYSELRALTIAFGEMCNISCIMCKQRKREKQDLRELDHKMLVKNVDPSPFQTIFLTGGEPLAISECRKYMEHLASVKKKFGLSTNGTLLDEATADFLAPNLDFITTSINAATKETHEKVNRGSDFNSVLKNLGYVRELRKANGLKFDMIGRMTLTVESLHDIPTFIGNYKELGFDKINFGYDKATVPAFLKSNPAFTETLEIGIRNALVTADTSRIDVRRLWMLGLLRFEVI